MSTESEVTSFSAAENAQQRVKMSQSIEWYSEGQVRLVEIESIRVSIRFVGRKGRRARIAVMAPAGAVFRAVERDSRHISIE